jgi:hypothetical protein
MTLICFNVYLDKKCIDSVWFKNMTCEEVKKSLIEHDGYDSRIVVTVDHKQKV